MFKRLVVVIVEMLIVRLTSIKNWLEPVVEAPVVEELPAPQPKPEKKPLFSGAMVGNLYSLAQEIEDLDITTMTFNNLFLFKQLIDKCKFLESVISIKTTDFASRIKTGEASILNILTEKE